MFGLFKSKPKPKCELDEMQDLIYYLAEQCTTNTFAKALVPQEERDAILELMYLSHNWYNDKDAMRSIIASLYETTKIFIHEDNYK